MNDPLEGIREKLERAYENIGNLDVEIASFFEKCEYPVIPKMNDEKYLEALKYHATLRIPVRFSVLAGETVHHLRSCLDHLIWQLSTTDYRASKYGKFIEFPILKVRPVPKEKFTRYKRKIKGVTSCRALKMIANIQPYRSARPELDALWIIHDLDRIDKHCELVIVAATGRIETTSVEIATEFSEYLGGVRKTLSPNFKEEFDKHSQVTPQVAFGDLGDGIPEPVIPLLTQLTHYVRKVVGLFEDELRG